MKKNDGQTLSQTMFAEIKAEIRAVAQYDAQLAAQRAIRTAERQTLERYAKWLEYRHALECKTTRTPPLYTLKQVAHMLRHLMPDDPPDGPPVIDTEPTPDPLPYEGA